MALAVLGIMTGTLAGCGPSEDDIPVSMTRDVYTSQQTCEQDWQAQDCTDQPASAPVVTGTAGGAHAVWMGPYHNASGRVYHANGDVGTLGSAPSHSIGHSTSSVAPSATISGGHAGFGEAAVSHGGFGAHGSGGHGGGGGHSGGG